MTRIRRDPFEGRDERDHDDQQDERQGGTTIGRSHADYNGVLSQAVPLLFRSPALHGINPQNVRFRDG